MAVHSFLVDVWEIPRSEIVLGKELGSGQFGVSVNHLFYLLYCKMDDGQASQPFFWKPAPRWRPLIPLLTGKYCKPNYKPSN